jgi:hypothetical protein
MEGVGKATRSIFISLSRDTTPVAKVRHVCITENNWTRLKTAALSLSGAFRFGL